MFDYDDRTKWEKFVDSVHIWFDIKIKKRVKPITNKIKMARLQKKLPKLNKKIDKLQDKSHKLESELSSAYLYDSDFEKAEKVNSNTQLYKQAGNSIVVNVLEGILKGMNL